MRPTPADLPRILSAVRADRLGYSTSAVRTELRNERWQRLATGVFLTRPDKPTRNDWAQVGVLLAGRGCAMTGWDVARLHGIASARPPTPLVTILTANAMNRVVGGVRISRTTRPFDRSVLAATSENLPSVPIVLPARAVVDTGLHETDLGRVRALVSAAVQRNVCTVDSLVAECENLPRSGSRLLRLAMQDLADGARSAAEAAALGKLRRARVPDFELNVPVVRAGRLIYRVDVLWRELRAVLEVDSREYHFSEADWKRTTERHNRLIGLGLAVVHYPPSEIALPGWIGEISAWLRARAAELRVPYRPGTVRPARMIEV